MTTANPVLTVENLVVEFPTRNAAYRAVNDVSFQLERGKTLCLVGESGSGKSVTARSILQILDPPGRVASGKMLLDTGKGSVDLARINPKSPAMRKIRGRDVAMIFQEPMSSLSPIHTIGNQIVEAIRLHEPISKRDARERSVELLRQVEIPNPGQAIDRYTFEFSGGMRQRAMIAMALACNPQVLIADEPTTALDVTIQAEILDLIRSIQAKRQMSVLFITHDFGVVAEIADKVAVMRYGKIVESGSALDIFEAPQHDYTKVLLNSVLELERPDLRRHAKRGEAPFGQPVIQVSALKKRFGARNPVKGVELLAVDNANVELRKGENLGIVGESGSGKTTLARCIQRIHTVTEGSILYTDGQGRQTDLVPLDEAALRPAWRDIRTVFQDPFASLNPRLTVEQLIGEPLYVMGKSQAEVRKRVAELLDLVGLPSSAMSRYPHAFSGGQRQRISIARALAPDPRVIIADEATSALDVSLRRQVLDLLLDLQQKLDLSFIFISHDFAVVRYFCDRVAVMYKGKIVEQGPTEEVCVNPQHGYTLSLLSAIPITDPRQRGQKQRVRYNPAVV